MLEGINAKSMLLSFEGIDGCGKSTQIDLLRESLEGEGIEPLVCREPGGTKISEIVRSALLDPAHQISPFAELLLFSAARAELVRSVVRPALAEGRVVILDRFYDSTVAYQGGGRGAAEISWLRDFNLRVTDRLVPDRTYLLKIPVSVALSRREERSENDRIELAGRDFYQRVTDVYDHLAMEEPDRFVVIDGEQTIEEIQREIWSDVSQLLTANVAGS